MKTYELQIDNSMSEAEEFVGWLNDQGHDASLTRDGQCFVDGIGTYSDDEDCRNANKIVNELWDAYCNAPAKD